MQAEQVCPADPQLLGDFLCGQYEALDGGAAAGLGEGSWLCVRLRHVGFQNWRVSSHASTGATRGRRRVGEHAAVISLDEPRPRISVKSVGMRNVLPSMG